MLFELRWHGVMCVHCPVECEERIPPQPRSMPRRAGRLHTQRSGELRDSDDSELICLCCWCYACFIFSKSGVLSLSVHLMYLFHSFPLPLPMCQCVCLWISHSFCFSLVIALWQSVVVVNVCSRPERLSLQFSIVESWRATLRSCSLKHTQAWNIHCELQHSGPKLFNRKPQRFLFTFILLSFTGFCHVAFREFGIVVSVCVFWCQVEGRMGKISRFTWSGFRNSSACIVLTKPLKIKMSNLILSLVHFFIFKSTPIHWICNRNMTMRLQCWLLVLRGFYFSCAPVG